MAIIIDRTITIKDDKATLDRPLYLYIGDGDITCIFTIEEKKKAATFGSINKTNSITENASYGEVRIYKPDPGSDAASRLVFTDRAEIIDDKLQVIFSYKNIDELKEAGVHQLQIHLYDDDDSERNRFTIPPIDINVLYPIGTDVSPLIDEAMVGYSLLDDTGDEEVPTFDEEGYYNITIWENGDIITKNKLNKIEDALYQINEANDIPSRVNIDDESISIDTTYSSNKIHDLITQLSAVDTQLNDDLVDMEGRLSNTEAEVSELKDIINDGEANFATKDDLATKADTDHTHDEYAVQDHTHDEYITESELPTIPTNVTDLDDHENYALKTDIPTGYIISNTITEIRIVDTLPAPEEQETGVLYIVKA